MIIIDDHEVLQPKDTKQSLDPEVAFFNSLSEKELMSYAAAIAIAEGEDIDD